MALRVLTISKPYVAAAYRNKLSALAALGRFEIGLICPPSWAGQAYEPPTAPEPFSTRLVDIAFDGHNHFHIYKGLERAVRDFRPDVLSVEEEHYSLVTLQAFRLARKFGAAAVFYTWQNIHKNYPPPFSWIEQSVFRQAAAAAGGNAESLAILRAKGYRGPLFEIPQMGVELARFAPRHADSAMSDDAAARSARKQALGLEPNVFWVAFLGRLVEEKGVQDLLRAVALLDAKPDARQVKVLLLGGGPYARYLQELAEQLRIGAHIVFSPPVPSQAVASYLQAVDALCLPSLTRSNWKEQFGRVLAEAMAAEAAVIGSSSGEIPNVIGDAGLVFAEGDAAALAHAVAQLRDDPMLLARCRERGARRVRERYTNAVVAERFAELFDAAVASKS